jgi:CubicO group peptidase (beta-lactamase class C family)
MKSIISLFLLVLSLFSCTKNAEEPDNTTPPDKAYFPSTTSSEWETKSIASLGWNQAAIQPLREFLVQKNTKAFMILVDGRIVMEEYYDGHNAITPWEWNSAGKTLIATTTGIAQQEGLLKITDKASDYLGTDWTSMGLAKENLITVRNLLTMTSGIDDTKQLTTRANLTYVADAGSRWAYGNVFQKLTSVVTKASNKTFEAYFNEKLKNKIGMDGYWNFGPIFTIYHSTARSMSRFGILALNNGKWNDEQVINESFIKESTSSSQTINASYGYLWWLNGKSSYMVPTSQVVFPGSLIPNAPADMFAAMGANDQRLYVIPSKKMVVIRMGKASDPDNPNFALSGFDNELWAKIKAVTN